MSHSRTSSCHGLVARLRGPSTLGKRARRGKLRAFTVRLSLKMLQPRATLYKYCEHGASRAQDSNSHSPSQQTQNCASEREPRRRGQLACSLVDGRVVAKHTQRMERQFSKQPSVRRSYSPLLSTERMSSLNMSCRADDGCLPVSDVRETAEPLLARRRLFCTAAMRPFFCGWNTCSHTVRRSVTVSFWPTAVLLTSASVRCLVFPARNCSVVMHARKSPLQSFARAESALRSAFTSLARQICVRRGTIESCSSSLKVTWSAICLSGRSTFAWGSLQMQMMGRWMTSLRFPLRLPAVFAPGLEFSINVTSMRMAALDAPSISSRMMQLGRRSSERTCCIWVPSMMRCRSWSGERSSLALISIGLKPQWRATMWARVVLPTPGGPDSKIMRSIFSPCAMSIEGSSGTIFLGPLESSCGRLKRGKGRLTTVPRSLGTELPNTILFQPESHARTWRFVLSSLIKSV
eukprot:m.255254 g.255254  ORF g.255254 m.255254 type:complete len:463 (-) comp11011_c0_seq9:762-2150(-)